MKPHIRYMSEWGWTCMSGYCFGYGESPSEAYERWRDDPL